MLGLVRLVEDVVQLLRSEIRAKGRSLVCDVDQKLWGVSEGTMRVTKILINLLSNAHMYTP